MPLTRRSFLQHSLAGAALAAVVHPRSRAGERPLNVIVLMSDEHNPKVASPMGHPRVETPHLARLAREGVVFENAYCSSPLCMPSRSAFMSGRRVHEIQCYNNCNVFPFDYPTFGGVLNDAGVHTVLLGKTDVFRPGAELGFTEYLLTHDRGRPGDENISRKPLAIRGDGKIRSEGFGPKEGSPSPSDDEVVRTAIEWLQTKPRTLNRPFVMIANIVMPHFPHRITPALWEKYADAATLPEHGIEAASAQHPYAQDLRQHFQTDVFTEEQIRGHRRAYLGRIEYVDGQIGKFLDALETTGLSKNTVFLYTSDHGEMLGKFGLWWKCSLYEDSVRVPLYAIGPGFGPGTRAKTPADLHDVQATLFAATGKARPAHWLGTPLQDLVAEDPERVVFAEYHGHGTRASGFLVRQADWKFLWYAEAPHQLFNLKEDPEELNNLAGKQPEKVKELDARLRSICNPEAENARAEAFIQRQLTAMGSKA